MKLQMSFGENLINLRKQKGWSQDDLADNLNLSRQAISKWENGTSKPDIDNIKKISKVFSVTIDDLLNNDVVKDKAVTLNVKKQEKKEKTITILKCMIIAVIILYIINVIFKFASLLIIVNGIQKYANLSNYHYVITTYDENGLVEKEECWFKDGVSKTTNQKYKNGITIEDYDTKINYNEKYGYVEDNILKTKENIDLDLYLLSHKNYSYGLQFYSNLPSEIKKSSLINYFLKVGIVNNIKIEKKDEKIFFISKNKYIVLNKSTLLPEASYSFNQHDNKLINKYYLLEINIIDDLNI